MNHFLLCGSHPVLSLAEAACILPDTAPIVIDTIALFNRSTWDGAAIQRRLAGAVKVGDIFASFLASTFSATNLADIIDALPRGQKVVFGLTLFGTTNEKRRWKQLPIQLKRAVQERNRSVRWFVGDQGTVSSAAVAKLDLIQKGYDFQIILHGDRIHVGLTTHVQDLDAWSFRDFGRPFRDATTGMLPPKLARLMVNLAGADPRGKTLFDPFCGGGTVLMEGALVGYEKQIGSDIDARQIQGSTQNLDWLVKEGVLPPDQRKHITLHTQPVETLTDRVRESIDVIVTEGFLGKPLNGNETPVWLGRQKQELETLWSHAFKTFAALQSQGGIVVASIPRHRVRGEAVTINADPAAEAEGYVRINPFAAWKQPAQELVYAREDQRVERHLCLWQKTK